ncbi:glycosyltransferase family 2 protein [Candidatus Pelagibacter sp.]|nr:glycosyltransferase family 2 protein [Candidatus Pelagibacter sp.]
MKVSIIIPVFNEVNTVKLLLDKVIENSPNDREIIIIDDFSNDGTRELLKNGLNKKIDKLILNQKNFGKGYSVRQGIKEASGDVILIQDADLEYNPSDYKRLLNPIVKYDADVVYGSRFSGSEEKRVLYFWHTIGNKFLTLLSNTFTNLNLTDMENCYKIFKRDIIQNIELKENRFGFEPEVTAKIAKKDIRIFEVGVSYNGRKYTEGKKITWRDGFSAIRCIIKYHFIN